VVQPFQNIGIITAKKMKAIHSKDQTLNKHAKCGIPNKRGKQNPNKRCNPKKTSQTNLVFPIFQVPNGVSKTLRDLRKLQLPTLHIYP